MPFKNPKDKKRWMKQRAERNQAAGFCPCGHDLIPGRSRCRRCTENIYRSTRSHRLALAGTTEAEYNRNWAAQNGVCAICGNPETAMGRGGYEKKLAADHNHATGQARGLLCYKCNNGIGYFQDRPDLLDAAAEYLRRYTA